VLFARRRNFAVSRLPTVERVALCRVSRQRLHSGTRRKLLEGMRSATDQLGVVLMRGGGPFHLYSTDMEGIFR